MSRIILNVNDEKKVEALLTLFRDLADVDAYIEKEPKKWRGNLPTLENPIHVEDFKMFSREELHER